MFRRPACQFVVFSVLVALTAAQSISNISPNSVLVGSPTLTLTVNGSGFQALSVVQFNGGSLPTVFVSSTQLNATVDASLLQMAQVAAVRVRASLFPVTFTNSVSFTVANPVPSTTSVSPPSAATATQGLVVQISGASFQTSSEVHFDGAPVPTSFVASTELQATISSLFLSTPGSHFLTVHTPAPGGGTSANLLFTVTAPLNPVPSITGISPSQIAAASGPTSVFVVGTGFLPTTSVSINGVPQPTTLNPLGLLSVAISAAHVAVPTTLHFIAVNGGPGGGVSNTDTVDVVYAAPNVSSINPNTVTAGQVTATLNLNGNGFSPATTALIGVNTPNMPVAVTWHSGSQLDVTLSGTDLAAGSNQFLQLSNPGPILGNMVPFTITNPAPTLSALSPDTVMTGSTAATLTVTGSGFTPQSVVRKVGGSIFVTSFVSPTELSAQIPFSILNGTPSVHPIEVFSPGPGGGASVSLLLTITPAPLVVTSVTRQGGGPVIAGDVNVLVVDGTGFAANSAVRWQGVDQPTMFVLSTQLTAVVSPTDVPAPGNHLVAVHNPGPVVETSPNIIVAAEHGLPHIVSSSPLAIPFGSGGAVTVQLTGERFTFFTQVRVDGEIVPSTFVAHDRVDVPFSAWRLKASRLYAIAVSNPAPGGGAGNSTSFSVAGPVISSVTPAVIPPLAVGSQPIVLTFSGNGFTNSVVLANGLPLPSSVIADTSISATIDATHPAVQAPGGVNLTVVATLAQGKVASNAVGLTVGTPTSPDNRGTVSVAPDLPGPSDLFTIRFEAPSPGNLVSTFLDLTQVGTYPIVGPSNWDVVAGVGGEQPIAIVDGLGILGPPTGHRLEPYLPASTPLSPGLGVIEVQGFFAPPVAVGLTFQFQAVFQDPQSPIGLSLSHVLPVSF